MNSDMSMYNDDKDDREYSTLFFFPNWILSAFYEDEGSGGGTSGGGKKSSRKRANTTSSSGGNEKESKRTANKVGVEVFLQ